MSILTELLTIMGGRFEGYVNIYVEGIHYFPHITNKEFNRLHKLVPSSSPILIGSYWNLYAMAKQSLNIEGAFFECGVFAGGSASFLANVMEGSGKTLHLFDTFKGMPKADPEHDTLHRAGDFANTSLEQVMKTVGHEGSVVYHEGWIPETFEEIDTQIAFAHVDVDLYQSVKSCCEYIWPRLTKGGVIVFDDYGHYTCPGAREAVDAYFEDKRSVPLSMITGQAVVTKI